MCKWRGSRMVGKAASRKSPPRVNAFTGWTTHSFHLCRPCGSNATILPPHPPPLLWSELQEWESNLWGWWGRQADIFSWITLSSGFLLLCFSGAHCKWVFFLKGKEKVLNTSTCGTSVTWLFPFQTLDLCLPATTQDAGSRGGGERCGQSGNAEDGGEDYAKCRPLLNMSLLSIIHRRAQTSLQIPSQPRSHSDEAWRQLSISSLNICRCYATKNVPISKFE